MEAMILRDLASRDRVVQVLVDLDLQIADQTAPDARLVLRALLDIRRRTRDRKQELVDQLLLDRGVGEKAVD